VRDSQVGTMQTGWKRGARAKVASVFLLLLANCGSGDTTDAEPYATALVEAGPYIPDPVESPAIDGLPDIPSNFDRQHEVQTSQSPVTAATDGLIGAFRFICQPGHLNWDDPIVYPGMVGGSPHLHQWFGNSRGNAKSTFKSLRSSGESGCMGPLNRSAYWMPAMLNGEGQVIRPDYIAIYYKRVPKSSKECGIDGALCLALPRGLRYIFGYDMLRLGKPQRQNEIFHWKCVTPDNRTLGPLAARFDQLECPPGNTLMVTLASPDCWDGRNLDSKGHRTHVVHQRLNSGSGRRTCPSSHPYLIPQFTLGAAFSVMPGESIQAWHLASDRMPGQPVMPSGATFHADWFGAWDDKTLKTWTSNCIDKILSCSAGQLGDGTIMRRPDNYGLVANPRLVAIPPRPGGMKHHNHE
jgi:Domain of unknown function (DUF1996)